MNFSYYIARFFRMIEQMEPHEIMLITCAVATIGVILLKSAGGSAKR